jgi:hypothetical protein
MPTPPRAPITVALVDDYDVCCQGRGQHARALSRPRVVIAELDSTMPVEDAVDIVLYDSFAQPESDHEEIPQARRRQPHPGGVVGCEPRVHT